MQRKRNIKLSEFKHEYLEYSRGIHTANSHDSAKAAMNEFERIICDVPLMQIGIRDVERFIAIKKLERSVFTARRCFVTVSAAFKKAIDWGYLHSNPFSKVTKPKLPEVPPKFLTQDEFRKLNRVIGDTDFRELCIIAVYTGMRQGELINLKWENIDLRNKIIKVVNSDEFTKKSKRIRSVPMNKTVYSILKQRKENPVCEYVFHRKGNKLKKDYVSRKFKEYVLLAGLDSKFNFHSLRHTCASWLVQAAVSLYVVQKILGHSSITVTEKYSYLNPSQLHEALEKLVGISGIETI